MNIDKEIEDAIKACTEKSKTADKGLEALQFSQAACNLANAYQTLKLTPKE